MSASPTLTEASVGVDGASWRMISSSSDQGLSPASLWARTDMRYMVSPATPVMRKLVCPSGRRSLSMYGASPA